MKKFLCCVYLFVIAPFINYYISGYYISAAIGTLVVVVIVLILLKFIK